MHGGIKSSAPTRTSKLWPVGPPEYGEVLDDDAEYIPHRCPSRSGPNNEGKEKEDACVKYMARITARTALVLRACVRLGLVELRSRQAVDGAKTALDVTGTDVTAQHA